MSSLILPNDFLSRLEERQQWFAGLMTQPLKEGDIQPYTPSGNRVEEEAGWYVRPTPTLLPHLCVQIYNRQYWWRLLNGLHTNFPLTVRLFGREAFDEEIGVPYLSAHRPHSWSLTMLGDTLPDWLDQRTPIEEWQLVARAARLDFAFISSFVAQERAPLNIAHMCHEGEAGLNQRLCLQPHVHLFNWPYDLLQFRQLMLEGGEEDWIERPFPDLHKGHFHFVLYRNHQLAISWRKLSQGEALLLSCFHRGATLEEACQCVETQEEWLYDEVASGLNRWMAQWTQANWLTLAS